MEIRIWDVQHGSAAHLRTPTGRNFAVDLGVGDFSSGDEVFSPLAQLAARGLSSLDGLIITHPHRDHLDDIATLDSLPPRVLVRPDHLTAADVLAGNRFVDTPVIRRYLEWDQQYRNPVEPAADPFAPSESGIEIAWFVPRMSPRQNLNNHSVVSFWSYAGITVCLPGDNETASWDELLADGLFCDWLKATQVFVAAHHGRESGFCEAVFEYCKPVLALVSDGPDCGTSVTDRYYGVVSGYPVWSQATGERETRYVLTTRCDGSIDVIIGRSGRPVLEVITEK